MKTPASRFPWVAVLVCLAGPAMFAAGKSDIVPSEKRRTAIVTGQVLAKPAEMPAVAADMVSPFNPPDFDQSEAPAATTAKAGGAAASASSGAPGAIGRMSSAREIIETMAPLIPATGTIQLGSETRLVMAGKTYRVGDVVHIRQGDSPMYDLEITSIKATEFTLRYQGEVKTRAIVIKPASSK